VLNAPTKLAAEWFGEKERTLAVSAGLGCAAMGLAFGFACPAFYISSKDSNEVFKK